MSLKERTSENIKENSKFVHNTNIDWKLDRLHELMSQILQIIIPLLQSHTEHNLLSAEHKVPSSNERCVCVFNILSRHKAIKK